MDGDVGGHLEFFIFDAGHRVVWFPVDTTFNGVWHHLAGTYDGTQLKLYVDGILQATQEHTGSIAPSIFNVNIGRNAECPDRFYEGLIDDVGIYDRALSAETIAALASAPAE